MGKKYPYTNFNGNSINNKKTRIFILCAGTSRKFENQPKALLNIDGESILQRTIRIIRDTGFKGEIFIVTHHDIIIYSIKELNDDKIKFLNPSRKRYILESMLSTKHEWVDRNIILYGDVIFSHNALKKILYSDNKIYFYARLRPSIYTKKEHHEVFGINIPLTETRKIVKKSEKAINYAAGRPIRVIFKSLFENLTGECIGVNKISYALCVDIYDTTDDIDSPSQYIKYIKKWPIKYDYHKFDVVKSNQIDKIEGYLILFHKLYYLNSKLFLYLLYNYNTYKFPILSLFQHFISPNSKLSLFFNNTYKFHIKTIITKLMNFIAKIIRL